MPIKTHTEPCGGYYCSEEHGHIDCNGAKADRLLAMIGQPPDGAHHDEWYPRAETWHKERANWESETKRLWAQIKDLERQVNRLETALVDRCA
jgi:hypothetical protein